MRLQLRWPAPEGEIFTADTARSLARTSTSIRFGDGPPVLALILFCHVVNDEIGNALIVTLDFDAPPGVLNGRGVTSRSGADVGKRG